MSFQKMERPHGLTAPVGVRFCECVSDLGDTVRPSSPGRIGRRLPRVVLPPATVLITLGMIEKRGIAMGVLAALTYGALASLSWLPPDRLVRWSRRHPVLDGLFFAPLLFCGLAYLTPLSLWTSLGITAVGTAALLAVARLRVRAGGQ